MAFSNSALADQLRARIDTLKAGDHRDLCRYHPTVRVDKGICAVCQEEAQLAHVASLMAATEGPADPARALAYKLREKGGKLYASSFEDAQAYRRTGERIAFMDVRPGGWVHVETARGEFTVRGQEAARVQFTAMKGYVRIYKGPSLSRRAGV